jgi:hypothetical protein
MTTIAEMNSATNENSTAAQTPDLSDHFRLENSDNPGAVLVTELLTTENYPTWSRAIRRAIRAKNKLGFLTGTLSKPEPSSTSFDSWERCNDMVVSWIQNAMSPSLRSSVAFIDEASEVWSELKDRFTQQNGPRIYELKKALADLEQEGDPVSIYYGKLKTIWDELSVYDPIPEYSCGQLKVLVDRHQRDCVIKFLMGLNEAYDNTRAQVMMLGPLPPVNKVVSYIQQQERQKKFSLC